MINIGVTGHRPHRLAVPLPRLAAQVGRLLAGLVKATAAGVGADGAGAGDGACLNIISPLAEGADRIVAGEALRLGQRLTALLPFDRRAYEATFSDPATTPEFRALWQAADERVSLHASPARPEAGYVAVGMVTLARSDLMLAIWDGDAALGRGGTAEILQSAVGWGVPVMWINARRDFKPVLLAGLAPDPASGHAGPTLADAVAGAALLDPGTLRGLVAALARR